MSSAFCELDIMHSLLQQTFYQVQYILFSRSHMPGTKTGKLAATCEMLDSSNILLHYTLRTYRHP